MENLFNKTAEIYITNPTELLHRKPVFSNGHVRKLNAFGLFTLYFISTHKSLFSTNTITRSVKPNHKLNHTHS